MMPSLLLSAIRNAINEDVGPSIIESAEFREEILRVYFADGGHHSDVDKISIMHRHSNDNFIVVRLLLLKNDYYYSRTFSYIFNIDDSVVDNILTFIRDAYNGNAIPRWRLWSTK